MLSHAITIHMSTNNLNLQHQLYNIYILFYIILKLDDQIKPQINP